MRCCKEVSRLLKFFDTAFSIFCLFLIIGIAASISFTGTVHAAEQDITLMWDESIDAPYLQSYRVYYYTVSQQPESLNTTAYAASYTLVGGNPISIDPFNDPKPITIDKNNTRITLHFSEDQTVYYFVVTAIDTRGLESIPTPEVSTANLGTITVNSGAAVTNSVSVAINIAPVNPSVPIVEMQFSNDGTAWSVAEPFAEVKPWILTAGDGVKTIYAKFKGSAGNWSPPVAATITLDTTPPTLAIGSPSAASTNSGPVSYTVTYTGAASISLSAEDITLNKTGTADGTAAVSGSGNFTRTVTLSNISGEGSIGISIAAGTATDTVGNQAAASGASATFTVENTEPPVYLSSQVTAGNIPGLSVLVVNSESTIVGVYDVADDGTWCSDLLPPGDYDWYLAYGNLLSAKNATVFDTSVLKSISGTITGLPAGGGVITVKTASGMLQKSIAVVADGAYVVDLLVPAADYQVVLVAPDVPVTYYDGKYTVNDADYVSIAAENATNINFMLTVPESHITGTVSESGGNISGLTVYGYEINTSATVFTRTISDGTYDLKAAPGTYLIFVIKGNGKIFYFFKEDGTPTQNETYALPRIITDNGQTIANTNIDITEGDRTLEGNVTYLTAGGEPVANALITVSTATEGSLGLTSADGHYSVGGLRSGVTYSVSVKPLSGNYPVQKTSIVAGVDTTKDFVIGGGAVLSGAITESNSNPVKPVSGAMYYIKDRQTGILSGGRVYYSDTNGNYSIHDVPGGNYTLEVFHSDYCNYSADLTIGTSNVTHQVAMEKGASFQGTVEDTQGEPVAGTTILATRDGATPVYTMTNSTGGYTIYGLDETKSDYIVIAQKKDYERQMMTDQQPSSSGTIVDFTLSKPLATYQVSGTVKMSDDSPVQNATVLVSSKLLSFFVRTTTAADGSYAVTGLIHAGNYTVTVLPDGNLPLQSNSFTVDNADISLNFTIPLGQEIAGYVFGSPIFPADKDIYVFLYKGLKYIGYTKVQDNTFSFPGLVEGSDYKILVTADGYMNQWYYGSNSISLANTIASGNTAVSMTLMAFP
ncbi:MAG: carboxypeptidase regulatory-like domain-containing protein [Deltaproteobacteria bacterium]|nr:carboxypeptidase regulatory-like domain-containing protein [Deltaproteobacteria bacterium]